MASSAPACKQPSRREIHDAIDSLGRLTELFQHRREQLAEGAGVTEQQWRFLEEISTESFIPSMFARRQESTPAAVSKVLRQLLDKSLVSVSVSKTDGRQRDYVLTAKGRRTLERLGQEREHAIRDIWADVDPSELSAFTSFSGELARRLEEYASRVHEKE